MSFPGWTRTRSLAAKKIAAGVALCTVALAAGSGWAAPTATNDVLRATLDNGLRVVIVRNTLAPAVTTVVNYLVGANETPKGFPGTAHAQEHMMFRGSPGLSADQLANIGSILGGDFNADTRQTVTQYYFTVPAANLDVALHIESLRMRGVDDRQADWVKERGAIEQEVAQDMSNPGYKLFTRLRETMFKGTPYAHDALGTRASFNRTSAKMLKDFHNTWYAPNNAVLVIAGNVDPQATLATVKTLFGGIPAKQLPPRPAIRLQKVSSASFTLPSDLPYGMKVLAFRLPGVDSPDFAAAEVLADVLSSQRGNLYGLVADGKALFADFSYSPLNKAGLAYATVGYPASGNGVKVEDATRAIIRQIAMHGVPADLVAAAKIQERSAAGFEKTSISGLATTWSEAVAVDGFKSPDAYLARIEKVTPADVNRVARKYLDLAHAVVATLTPQQSGQPVSTKHFGGKENIALGATHPTPLPTWAQSALEHISVPVSTIRPTVSKLANGLTLVVQPETVSNAVSVVGHVRNRPDVEVPHGQDGVDQILEQMFSYGTKHLSRVAFQQALDAIGADESAGADFSLDVLAENFQRGVHLLADNELHPAFGAKAFRIVQRQVAESAAGRLKSPGHLTSIALRKAVFPLNDPTLRETRPKTVDGLTLGDVRAYYKKAFRPDLTTIVVIGNVTPAEARRVIDAEFGAWTATGPTPNVELPAVPDNGPSVTAVPDNSRVQDQVVLGESLTLTRDNPDFYALELGNTVLGGAFYSTRLSVDLRKKAGLVYSISSDLEVGRTRGLYLVDYACDPSNVSKVHDAVVQELKDMQTTLAAPDEMQRAKALLLREIPLSEASFQDIADGLLYRIRLGLPLDEPTLAAHHFLALDAAQVKTAFAKWLRPTDLVQISEGPQPS